MKRRGFLQGIVAAIAFLSATAYSVGAMVTKVVSPKRRVILPPIPKWNRGTDDLDGRDYQKRSEDFERSFLPKDLVFPLQGEVWELTHDCEVWGQQAFVKNRMAITRVQLTKGERVRILPSNHPRPLQVRFQRLGPDDASCDLSIQIARTIPGQTRATAYFNELFRLSTG